MRQIGAREANGGQRRQRELGEVDVVQPDDREVLGHAQPFVVGGAQNANGGHVVRANDRGRARGERLQLPKSGHAALRRVVALDDPLLLNCQPGGLHRRAKVVLAGDGRVQLVRAGKKG